MEKSVTIYKENGLGVQVAKSVAEKHGLRDGATVNERKAAEVVIDNCKTRIAEIKKDQEAEGGAK